MDLKTLLQVLLVIFSGFGLYLTYKRLKLEFDI